MRLLQMSGSYPLTAGTIDDVLKRKSPGNYALGYLDGDTFSVFYVGRSDSDVRKDLFGWVDKPATYGRFWSPTKAAWTIGPGRRIPVESPALDQAGNDGEGYTRFAYSYAASAEEAYAKEWRNYDFFGGHHGLDNEASPTLRSTELVEEPGTNASQETHLGLWMPTPSRRFSRSRGNQACGQG